MNQFLAELIAVCLFLAINLGLHIISKHRQDMLLYCLAPAVGSSSAATLYLALYTRRLIELNVMHFVMVFFTALLLVGAIHLAWNLYHAHVQRQDKLINHKLCTRGLLMFALLVVEGVSCNWVALALIDATQMTALVSAGLLYINWLVFLFPFAALLLAVMRIGKRQVELAQYYSV